MSNDQPRVHPDQAQLSDVLLARVDQFSHPETPRGVLIAALDAANHESIRCHIEAERLRARAADYDQMGTAASHRRDQLTAAVRALDAAAGTTTPAPRPGA